MNFSGTVLITNIKSRDLYCKYLHTTNLYVRLKSVITYTLQSGRDVGQGINVGPGKFVKKINVGPQINVGHEQNVQSYVTKNPSNLKISVGYGKNSKI